MLAVALLSLAAFAAVPAEAASPLCARKGNVDKLEPIPGSLVPAAARLFGVTDPAAVQSSTVYRCMGGRVWLCNHGANLVCGKANTSRSNPGVENWCRENPNAAEVPMAATGHDTIYSWRCVRGKPRLAGTIAKVDARGFLADNWKLLR
jgi:hypothetical protein